jgi:release factor glutamine methyltransferase
MARLARELLAAVSGVPAFEARRLLEAAVGASGDVAWLLGDRPVAEDVVRRFGELVARRIAGEPLQYLEGTVQFGPVVLAADPRALIPRPETEGLWELVVAAMPPGATVVDLCTGSGNIALACKQARPDATVVAVDSSAAAIALAGENATRLGLEVTFLRGDLFDPLRQQLRGAVDVLVANPPYVSSSEFGQLPVEVRDFEPAEALLAGPDGTEVLARIAAAAGGWLAAGGLVACEIGEDQGEACLRLFDRFRPEIRHDLTGRDRYVVGRAPEPRDVD